MDNIKKLFLLICVLAVTGCAGNFSEQQYEYTSWRMAIAKACNDIGFIDSKQLSYYLDFQMNGYSGQWKTDKQRLHRMYMDKIAMLPSHYSDDDKNGMRLNCASVETAAERVKPSGNSTPAPVIVQPKVSNTTCNKIGTMTTCTHL